VRWEETMSRTNPYNVTDAIDRLPVSRFQINAILLCALVALLDGFDTQMIAFVAPAIAKEWSVEMAAFGPIFGAGLLGLTVGILVFGPVADRVGRRPVIIWSTLAFGACALATVLATNLTSLFVFRFLTGLGLGGAIPNIIALTSEYTPARRRATLITMMYVGFPLGAVLGGALSAKLLSAYDWHAVFYLGGILPIILVPLLYGLLPESIKFLLLRGADPTVLAAIVRRIDPAVEAVQPIVVTEERHEGLPIRHLFSEGRAVGTALLWVVFFCNLLMLYFLINWLPPVLSQAGLPAERAIIGTVLLNAGGIVGGLALGWLVDKRGPCGILAATFMCAAIFVALIGCVDTAIPLIMSLVFFSGFFVIGSQFCMNALAANFYPTAIRATGVGWALGIGRIGSIIGPVAGGWVISLGWGTPQLFYAAAAPALLSSIAVLLIGLLGLRTSVARPTVA
jgi:MFS transporter, AAHS family, 4-hydroxybenzoate transporter